MRIWLGVLLVAVLGTAAFAQDSAETDNSYIVTLIEDGLSSDDRQIKLIGIDGLLASEATIEAITVADRDGVWLTVRDAKIVWSRLALLRGRLSIDTLSAKAIEVVRKPLPSAPALPSPEARTFAIPELPLSVNVGSLSVGRIVLAEEILGQAAELGLTGNVALEGGGLDAKLAIERLDVAEARIGLELRYAPGGDEVLVDLAASEPADGIIANLLAVPNRPALDLTLKGAGPVNDLKLDLDLLANKLRQVTGTIVLDDAPGGLGFDVDIAGKLAFLTTGDVRPFFKGESTLKVAGRQLPGGGLALDELAVETASLQLSGGLETTADGFLRRARVTGQLGDGVSQTVLPFGGGANSVRELRLAVSYGEDGTEAWDGGLTGTALILGDISAAEFGIDLGGVARNLDQADQRFVTLEAAGGLQGLRGATPDLTRALGRALDLTIAAQWASGKPFKIDTARIEGNGTRINLAGELDELVFDGKASVEIARLAPFAGLAGRDLKGALSLALEGSVAPVSGAFDLGVSGFSEALKLDIGQADRLLAGRTDLSGRAARDENGLRTENLRLTNDQLDLRSDGFIASDKADLRFAVALNELRDLTASANGPVRLTGSARGTGGRIALNTEITVDEAEILDRPLSQTRAGFTGTLQDGAVTGRIEGRGRFGTGSIRLNGGLDVSADGQALRDFSFSVGPSALTGEVVRDGAGLMTGAVAIASPDVSDLAALAFLEAGGRVTANVTLLPNDLGQQVTVSGKINDLEVPQAAFSSADIRLVVQNAFGVPGIVGAIDFGAANIAGVAIKRGRGQATQTGPTTEFQAGMDLVNGTMLSTLGTLTALETGYELAVTKLDLDGAGPDIALANPAALTVQGSAVSVRQFDLNVGEGQISARGEVDTQLDLALDLTDVPLEIANAVVDDLGAEGALSATARITGAPGDPKITFDARVDAVTTTLLKAAELPAFDVTAKGQSADAGLVVAGLISGPGNFDASVDGYVPLDGGQMDLDGTLRRLPLALIDGVAGQPGLRGIVDGTFGIAGRLNKPRVRFDLDADGISARVARENGIPPVRAQIEGSFANDTVILPVARIDGGAGLNFVASGRIPLFLDGLDVSVEGAIPLSIANVAMARSGMNGQGTINMDMRATGRITAPVLAGQANLSGATFTAPRVNLRLEDLNASVDLNGDQVRIRNLSARGSRGGTIQANGSISVSTRSGMPADIQVVISDLDYTDAKLLATTVDGTLSLTGTLLRRPFLRGDVTVSPLEITIPNRLPASTGFSIDVRHVNTSAAIARTLKRAETATPTSSESAADGAVSLDVTVRAPNRVFVRGRGLDAELGGTVRVTGTLPNYKPNGRFELVRGRLALLGQRINLNSGAIILTGTKIPDLLMEARVVTDEIEATFFMEGPASAPELSFTSVPDLPDDEILARVLFGRAISELSPLQVARLAAAVGELSGRTGPGVFDQIREATGLDDLDFQTAEDGTTTVQAGKYIQENVYSTIEADSLGNSKATINLDINENVTARGSVESDGNTTIGIFFEKDY